MRANLPISASWFLWGSGYYLYYPYISIYLQKVLGNSFSYSFIVFTLFAIPFSLLGGVLHRVLGVKGSAILGMGLSGVGLFLLQMSSTPFDVLMSGVMIYTFFISLPNFYSAMASLDSKCIARIWSISVIPSTFMPAVGGFLSQSFGIPFVFLISAIITAASGLPVSMAKFTIKDNSSTSLKVLPFLSMIPIATSFPFVYVRLTHFGFSLEEVGIMSTLAEVIGLTASFLSTRAENFKAMVVLMSLFSLVGLESEFPYFSLAFGLWEAIIPVSLEGSNSTTPWQFGVINAFQQMGWLIGFVVSYIVGERSLLVSSLFSILVLLYVLRNRDRISR